MEREPDTTLERAAIVGGVATGVALGLVGNALEAGTTRDFVHALSSIGLVVAAALLAVRMGRAGHVPAAAGFAIVAVAETMMWSTGGPSAAGPVEGTFAMAVLFSAPGLALVASAPTLAAWARAAGALAGVLFAVHGLRYLGGAAVTSEDGLVGAAYMLLSVAALGWGWSALRPLLRREARPRAAVSTQP